MICYRFFFVFFFISAIWFGVVGFVKHLNLLKKKIEGGEVENHVAIWKEVIFSAEQIVFISKIRLT